MTSSEAKIVNRAFNELYKLREVKAFQDTLLGTKDRKIEILQFQVDARSEQLILSNTKIMKLELANKKLRKQIILYKIGVISISILTILVLI